MDDEDGQARRTDEFLDQTTADWHPLFKRSSAEECSSKIYTFGPKGNEQHERISIQQHSYKRARRNTARAYTQPQQLEQQRTQPILIRQPIQTTG